jgi:chromosome segregation ATPase
LELWLKTPELIAGTILLLLAVGGFAARLAWKSRDHTATQREANLQNSITDLQGRLHDCREDLRDAKGELRDAVRQAKDDQQRIAKEVEELRRENNDLRSAIEAELEKNIKVRQLRTPQQQETVWVKIVRDLADRSDTIDRHVTALSTATTALEGTLSDITKKIADTPVLTEPSDNGKRSKT